MPAGDALRMCFPPHLFIYLIYLYISLWAQPLVERARPGLFLFIPPDLSGIPYWSFVIGCEISPVMVEMKQSPPRLLPPLAPHPPVERP